MKPIPICFKLCAPKINLDEAKIPESTIKKSIGTKREYSPNLIKIAIDMPKIPATAETWALIFSFKLIIPKPKIFITIVNTRYEVGSSRPPFEYKKYPSDI